MFNNPRYLTRGVSNIIPPPFQAFIWGCIERLPDDCDYLQVFRLKPFGGMQQIEHTAEDPAYRKIYLFPFDEPITEKIYILDSDSYCTMLLASEY